MLLETTLWYRSINKQLRNFSDNYHPYTTGVYVIYKKNQQTKVKILLYCSAVMANCTIRIHLCNSFRYRYDETTAVCNCRDSTPLNKMWNRPAWSLKNPGGAEGSVTGPHGQQYQRLLINQDSERSFSAWSNRSLQTLARAVPTQWQYLKQDQNLLVRFCVLKPLCNVRTALSSEEKGWGNNIRWEIASNYTF